jgi:hypothetical protein
MSDNECIICQLDLTGTTHYHYLAEDEDEEDQIVCLKCVVDNGYGCPDEVIEEDGTRRNGIMGIDDMHHMGLCQGCNELVELEDFPDDGRICEACIEDFIPCNHCQRAVAMDEHPVWVLADGTTTTTRDDDAELMRYYHRRCIRELEGGDYYSDEEYSGSDSDSDTDTEDASECDEDADTDEE